MQTAPPLTILEAALQWHSAGVSVVPARNDGSKAPAAFWKQHQIVAATTDELHAWFATNTYDGLGVITGRVSGHLEMIEIEGRAIHLLNDIRDSLTDNGYGHVWQAINDGYTEITPRSGIHWYYRTEGPAKPNTKLASKPNTNGGIDVLIETRGEGGFSIIAPSHGRAHPTGNPWIRVNGTPHDIPTITRSERDALHGIIHALYDETPEPVHIPPTNGNGFAKANNTFTNANGHGGGLRPGDDYNQRVTWEEILTPHGWTKRGRLGEGWAWTRPGKNPREGISATTNTRDQADRLYVFSTSTIFEAERSYDKFHAYALLHHADDFSAAASALRNAGYGDRTHPPTTAVNSPTAPTVPAVAPSTIELGDDEDFWATRPILQHIHTAAFARMASPWATLGYVIARMIANTPPNIQLPPIIGGNASLNTFIALVGASGGGKGAAKGAALSSTRFAIELLQPLIELQPGSGEGLAHMYGEQKRHPETNAWYTEQIRDRVFLDVNEIDTLTALKSRQGSTLGSILRSFWSGEALGGHAYVDATKRVSIPPHSYRAGLVMGIQPECAGPVLNEASGGTPQRFIWLPTSEKKVSVDVPDHPGVYKIEHRNIPVRETLMGVPDETVYTIRAAHVARMRGEGDALDGHELLSRLKLAAAFALLDYRTDINFEDWELSECVMRVSNKTRDDVKAALRQASRVKNHGLAYAEVERDDIKEDFATQRVVARVLDRLTRAGGATATPSELRRAMDSRDRPYVDAALTRLSQDGRVDAVETPRGFRFTLTTPRDFTKP